MRRILMALLLLLLLGRDHLAAQEHLLIQTYDDRVIMVQPGQIVTTTFRVENRDLEEQEFGEESFLPAQWRRITDHFPFLISQGKSDIRIFSVHVPALTPPGDYIIGYRVASRAIPEISDSREITVRVQQAALLELQRITSPDYAFAGDTVKISFRLTNRSNQEKWIALSSLHAILVGDSLIQLNAGASTTIVTEYRVAPRLAEAMPLTLSLTARFLDKPHSVQQSARVTLMPRRPGQRHDLALPGELSLNSHYYRKGDLRRDGLQGDLSFKGYLDLGKEHHIDVHLRGPDQYRVSSLGQHDEYYATYSRPGWTLEAGDQGFSLSTLTEMYKYGRGLQSRFTREQFAGGLFFMQSRFYSPSFAEQGAWLQYQLAGVKTLRLNYLHKEKEQQRRADLVSLQADVPLEGDTAIELEAALGRNGGRSSGAGRIELRGSSRRLYFNGYLIKSDARFPGYYRNSDMANLNLSLNLGRSLLLDFSLHQDYQNADLDTLLYSAPFSRYVQSGFSCHPRGGTTLRLYLRNRTEKDRLPQAKFNYSQQSLRLQAEQAWQRLSLNLTAEKGNSQNHLAGYKNNDQEMFYAMAAVSLLLHERDGVGGFISYSNNNRYNDVRVRDLLAGLNGQFTLHRNTRLNLTWRSGYTLEDYYLDRNIFELGVVQDFSAGKRLDLRARYTLLRNSLDRRELAAVVNATIPFNLPLPVKSQTGALYGRIINLEGRSVEGLILHLGEAKTATLKDGSYRFPQVKPGSYPLLIDPRSMSLHEVVLEKLGPITISAGCEEKVHLTLCRSAELCGRMVAGNQGAEMPELDLSGIIVELDDGVEAVRCYCDRQGRYGLRDIRPGRYMLTVYDRMLEGWQIRDKKRNIDLAAGEKKYIDFVVAGKVKVIHFQQSWKKATKP